MYEYFIINVGTIYVIFLCNFVFNFLFEKIFVFETIKEGLGVP